MIENPSNLTQQLLNLVERVAVEIRAIYNKLKTAVFKVNGQTPDSDGNIQIDAVTKATQDGDGNVISNTYVKKTDKVTNASSADSATKATQDASGNIITSTYATKTELNAKQDTATAFKQTDADKLYLAKVGKAVSATSADSATKATQDASGNVITATYATKAELSNKLDTSSAFTKAQADNLYLGKSAKAASASQADTAVKATQDASGNIITSTYATKAEVTQSLAGKANASHTHTTAQVTGLDTALAGKAPKDHTHTIANVTGLQDALNAAIPKTGNRGALAGYSTSATGTTVNATSGDSLYASANVTVANGATGQTWTKVVKLSAGTVTLGTNWSWVGGEAPELKYPCLLVCHWNQDKGIAGIVAGVA